MTKRKARKIATLRAAVILSEDDTLHHIENLPMKHGDKIVVQQQEIAEELAKRYDLELHDIPTITKEIVNGVLDGSL